MENKLITFIQDIAPRSYCPPESLECADSKEAYSIKCAEGVYLNVSGSGWTLRSGEGAVLVGDLETSADLAGWSAELTFAPGKSMFCEFGEGSISCGGEALAAVISKLGDDLYLAAAEDGAFAMVLDMARFLFYGALNDVCFGGYMSLPA